MPEEANYTPEGSEILPYTDCLVKAAVNGATDWPCRQSNHLRRLPIL